MFGTRLLGGGITAVGAALVLLSYGCEDDRSAGIDDPSPVCEAYEDQAPEPVRILIENRRTTSVYFEARDFCSADLEPTISNEEGAALAQNVACGESCEEKMMEGYWGCADGDCGGPALSLLPPGATFEFTWNGGVRMQTELPDECIPEETSVTSFECLRLVGASAGTYTASITAFTSATCTDRPCVCNPAGSTTCPIFEQYELGENVTVEQTFELPLAADDVVRLTVQ